MKRLLFLAGFLGVLALSPSLANAQTVTRAELQAVLPQLSNVVSALGTTTTHIQRRIATENALFADYSNLLGAWSVRLSQTPQPTSAEIDGFRQTLVGMNEQISISTAWRAQVNATVPRITEILGNITSIIARAT